MRYWWQLQVVSNLCLAMGCSSSISHSPDGGLAEQIEVAAALEVGATADGEPIQSNTGGSGGGGAGTVQGGSRGTESGGSAGVGGSKGTGGVIRASDAGIGAGGVGGSGGRRSGTGGTKGSGTRAGGTSGGSGGAAEGTGGTSRVRDAGMGGATTIATGGATGGGEDAMDPATPEVLSSSTGLGAHAAVFKRYGESRADLSTPQLTTSSANSLLLACAGRGAITAHSPPKDNKGNQFSQLGTTHSYTNWTSSGTACYAAVDVTGGSGHVVTALAGAISPTDETTLAVVEITNAAKVSDFQWNEVLKGKPLTSRPVTTSGPATLVAFWWGDGDGSVNHVASPNNGFTVIDSVLASGDLVQCAVAVKTVSAAGTYDVTWTSNEGAQMWLMAVE